MTPVETLLEIEAIRELVARRVRCIDEKDWAGFSATYAPDAVSYSVQGPGGVEIMSTASGSGYWIQANDGSVWAFGDAQYMGGANGQSLNAPIVGAATKP